MKQKERNEQTMREEKGKRRNDRKKEKVKGE